MEAVGTVGKTKRPVRRLVGGVEGWGKERCDEVESCKCAHGNQGKRRFGERVWYKSSKWVRSGRSEAPT
jgi:hypothetical protein